MEDYRLSARGYQFNKEVPDKSMDYLYMALDNFKLLELLKKMVLARKMEEKHAELLADKKPIAFAHFSTGMEAVGIGAMTALRKDDVMIGSHRGFAEYIGKGMEPLDIWAEYLGKKHILDGKAGIQVSDRENNIPGMTACIGGGFAIAAGMAYAILVHAVQLGQHLLVGIPLLFSGHISFKRIIGAPAEVGAGLDSGVSEQGQ